MTDIKMKSGSGLDFFFILIILCLDAYPCMAEPLLLFVDRFNIRSYDLDTGSSDILVPSGFASAMAMDFHYGNQKLYVSDVVAKKLHVVDMSVSPADVSVLLDSGLGVPDGLAVDWINNNLYWTDTGKCNSKFIH